MCKTDQGIDQNLRLNPKNRKTKAGRVLISTRPICYYEKMLTAQHRL